MRREGPIGLAEELASVTCCIEACRSELRTCTDGMRRLALLHTNTQAVESMIALYIEKWQLEASNNV